MFRPGQERERPEDLLGQACALVRLCGRDSAAAAAALDERVRDAQLRRPLSAAHRCGELSWQAVAWSAATAVLFLFWTPAAQMAGG